MRSAALAEGSRAGKSTQTKPEACFSVSMPAKTGGGGAGFRRRRREEAVPLPETAGVPAGLGIPPSGRIPTFLGRDENPDNPLRIVSGAARNPSKLRKTSSKFVEASVIQFFMGPFDF